MQKKMIGSSITQMTYVRKVKKMIHKKRQIKLVQHKYKFQAIVYQNETQK